MILTKQQSKALNMVRQNKLSILCGFPGSGKTTTVKAIVDLMKLQPNSKVLLASPTGKASKVLASACNHKANTIHRMLHPLPVKVNNKLQFQFTYNADNKLDCSFLVLDECSMISNSLAASLFQAIDSNKTKVLLVGDSSQLCSVESGNVFADLIASNVIPVTELSDVFRHSGEIIKLCCAIRTDDKTYVLPEPPAKIDLEFGLNVLHIECSSMEGIHNTIVKLATENMPRRGFHVNKGDVQILSPVNEKTVLSCHALNKAIQDVVNPQPVENVIENKNGGEEFRLGSRVINCRNIYDATSTDDGSKQIVLNGDQGVIIDLQGNKRQMIIEFDHPARKILVNKWKHHLKLSYAVTAHRSQGSQFDCVLMPVHSVFKYSFGRSLLYTAVSRASKLLIMVGERKAIRQAVKNTKAYFRQTQLKEKIEERLLDEL